MAAARTSEGVGSSRELDRLDARALRAWLTRISGLAPGAAGILGGLAMGAYEIVATWSAGGRALDPLRIIGAGHPDFDPVWAGLLMHFVTAGFWGAQLGHLLMGAPTRLLRLPVSAALGLVWGVILWLLMGLVIGPLFSRRLAEADPVHYFVGHAIYGLVSVVALAEYVARARGSRADVVHQAARHPENV